RSVILQALLSLLMLVVVSTSVLNVLLIGVSRSSLLAQVSNLVFVALIAVAMFVNRKGHFRTAVTLILGVTLFAASLPPLVIGINSSTASLLLFFVPLGLAGLLLGRLALYATIAWGCL